MDQKHMLYGAVYVILKSDDKILLLRRFNTGWMDGWYTPPAGHLEKGENIFTCAMREIFEETGLVVRHIDLIPVHTLHRLSTGGREYTDFFFMAETWHGTPLLREPDRSDILQWFKLSELPDNLLSYITHVLREIDLGNAFSIHGWD